MRVYLATAGLEDEKYLRLLGLSTLLGACQALRVLARVMIDTANRQLAWRRWSKSRQRQFNGWLVLTLVSLGIVISGLYTVLTGDPRGQDISLKLIALWSVMFVPMPCSYEPMRTRPALRRLRMLGLLTLGGAALYLSLKF